MSLELALEWADRGIPVLPVNGQNKRPLIKAWQEAATTSQTEIHAWWFHYPDARVGLATGGPGFDVLDFDVAGGKPGLEQLERLLDAGVLVPGTFAVVATPSGGRHVYFQGSEQRNKQNERAIPGVDFRGAGGMVLAPGNPGYRYVSGALLNPPDLKRIDWLAVTGCLAPEPQRLVVPQPAATAVLVATPRSSKLVAPIVHYDNAAGEESPLDWFCANNDLGALLRQDGWRYVYTHQERDYYVRPGKDPKDGVSANVMINVDGRQTLINFSTSVNLPTDRGLSAAQYWAHTRMNGNVKAAASEIRRTMMPRRERAPSGHLASSPVTSQGLAGMSVPPRPAEGSPGAEVVPSGQQATPEPIKRFWDHRPELREVWFKAQIGGVSPWAVLGNILAEVAGRIGPHMRLPPLGGVGAAASLNILVAVSGNSGAGKGRSSQVAREFMGAPRPPHRKPGTGQGIAAMFTTQTKEGPVQENDTVVLNVAEITQLGAHMNQQGATITSTLLEVYMAEELGEHYANKELRRPVREGAYRLALVAGVQPDNSAILFDHAASGLPQRFLWMPAIWLDAILPESGLKPPAPGPELGRWRAWSAILPGTLDDTLDATGWSPTDAAGGLQAPGRGKKDPEAVPAPLKDEVLFSYAPGVGRTIETDHTRRLNAIKKRLLAGDDDPGDPDSHLLLTRIKVAALLAVWLDGMLHIGDEVWELAGLVIWVSNDTRLKAHGRIQQKAAEKNRTRAAAQIAQRAIVDAARDSTDDELIKHVATRIRTVLDKTPGRWTATRVIGQGIAGRDKKKLREAGIELLDVLGDMHHLGEIERQETERGGNTAVEWRK